MPSECFERLCHKFHDRQMSERMDAHTARWDNTVQCHWNGLKIQEDITLAIWSIRHCNHYRSQITVRGALLSRLVTKLLKIYIQLS